MTRIIYALPCGLREADTNHDFTADLIALGQSLRNVRDPVELFIVTLRAFQCQGTQPPAPEYLARTVPLCGIVKALVTELPCLHRAVHIDVDDDAISDPTTLARVVRAEMASPSTDHEVAIRGGIRYVRRLTRMGTSLAAEIASAQRGIPYFQPDKAYVVAGGLGGIGINLIKQILDTDGTHVLIIGRRKDVTSELSTLGWDGAGDRSRVSYAAVDLGSDLKHLEQAIQHCLDVSGKPLGGIVQLAGAFERTDVSELTTASFQDAIRAKVQGSIQLHQVLKQWTTGTDRPQFLHFGSAATLFAGRGLAAYSGACRFQEEFAVLQRRDGVDSRVCSWSMWEATGIGGRDRALGFAPWVCPIAMPQGLTILTKLLNDTCEPDLYIGINLRHPDLARLSADSDDVDYFSLCVFHTPEAALDVARSLSVSDTVRFVRVPQLPMANGELDLERLRTASFKSLTASEQGGPQGQLEETLFTIWKEVLGITRLDRHDNFFELGGDSLSWSEMTMKVGKALALRLQATQIMQHGCVAELAHFLDSRPEGKAIVSSVPRVGSSSELLVTLKRGTNPALAPVFIFPTIAGTTSCFNELLSNVNALRPMVGITDPYLQGDRRSRLLSFDDWMIR
ncbi:MAG TPA: SDR family NAD(P)-dependent oxidoreductase, partial [Pirellulaceae bacterium]